MKVRKVINNNIVSSADEDGREIVVMGRGIGFQAREGWEIPEERIEKIFRLDNKDSLNRFKDLLARLPLGHIQISDEIISYGKKVLNKPLNHNIYITLTDHINFAVERHRQNMMFPNPLLREVRSFYREEYLIGEYALALIKKKLGIDFPVDEAASIALHLVNAEYNTAMRDTINITRLIEQVVGIVSEYFNFTPDESSLHYERFVTHLKFLAQRIYSGELLNSELPEFAAMIEMLYPEEYICSQKIQYFIQETYGHRVTDEEAAYLAVHIKRMRTP
ncbi:MAG TPA: PRD domain-containing protein [Candidatus Cottocaccamicrobium excrementipullorum]|nr:PRD domain-containing protein [Candidatus Cottocaccamicrobium excrementipullorum]